MNTGGWLLLIVLFLLIFCLGYFFYCFHFLRRFSSVINMSRLLAQTPVIDSVPYLFRPFYCEFQKLALSLIRANHIDRLTGLPNRVALKELMQTQLQLHSGTVILLDIKRFRHINDVFGFSFGDNLLKAVTVRLQTWLAQEDFLLTSDTFELPRCILARMEGDEFIFYSDIKITDVKVRKLKTLLEQEYIVDNTQILLKFQFGIVDLAEHCPLKSCGLFDNNPSSLMLEKSSTHLGEEKLQATEVVNKMHSSDQVTQDGLSLLLKRADVALKRAKSLSDLIAWYREGDDSLKLREHQLLSQLPKALRDGELFLEYQPKLNVHSGDYQQVEALIRWQHPEFGLISPAEFIPLAEGAGIIDIVSHWALDHVLCQQRCWQDKGLKINVAVNFSSQDIVANTLFYYVEEKLIEYAIDPQWLTIEVTESALMQDLDLAVASLLRLNQLGVKLAIDDFGTGHSSLAYLKYFPIHEVKIDKVFLNGIDKESNSKLILQTCISLATNLGFDVTVEGVEDKVTADLLISMGVDTLQGQVYASSMTSQALFTWLKS